MLTIQQAAYEGKLYIVQQMVEKENSLVNSFDQDGRNALHWAASGGHADIVNYLIAMGAIVNSQDKDAQWTPLMIAVSAGHLEVVKILLQNQADPALENDTKQTALHYAASKNRIDIARLLIEHQAPVNQLNRYKQTPLHQAASSGHIKIIELLLVEGKARVNPKDIQGNTPLHHACEEEHGDCALRLIENNGNLDALNTDGKSPLDLCPTSQVKSFILNVVQEKNK
ncbi:hypothetical protein [Parasitella parasitica]|uniref:Uncharacterized protein n=1 Tax=Parasitella parasitica TaxID=35722 RepID=A0A0B7N161_9FUNG|nr:hypothetical protein [Parasitella parasitica]